VLPVIVLVDWKESNVPVGAVVALCLMCDARCCTLASQEPLPSVSASLSVLSLDAADGQRTCTAGSWVEQLEWKDLLPLCRGSAARAV